MFKEALRTPPRPRMRMAISSIYTWALDTARWGRAPVGSGMVGYTGTLNLRRSSAIPPSGTWHAPAVSRSLELSRGSCAFPPGRATCDGSVGLDLGKRIARAPRATQRRGPKPSEDPGMYASPGHDVGVDSNARPRVRLAGPGSGPMSGASRPKNRSDMGAAGFELGSSRGSRRCKSPANLRRQVSPKSEPGAPHCERNSSLRAAPGRDPRSTTPR